MSSDYDSDVDVIDRDSEGVTPDDGLRIVRLRAENVKRLRAVEIKPNANGLVQITGRNGAGKTSVLDAIAYALGGKALCPSRPIRDGHNNAEVEVDLGEIKVKRYWTKKTTRLEVTTANGFKAGSPQALLDKLVGRLTFDPLEFTRLPATAQRDTLLDLLGIQDELRELDARHATLYQERADKNRQLKVAKAAREALPPYAPDTPDEPVSVSELAAELAAAREQQATNRGEADHLHTIEVGRRNAVEALDGARRAAARLTEQLHAANQEVVRLQDELAASTHALVEQRTKVNALIAPPLDKIEAKLAAVDDINHAVRNKQRHAELRATADRLQGEWAAKDNALGRVTAERAAKLAAAQLPVDGLAYDDEGVTLNGVPFTQVSSAEQLRCSVAIAMVANPDLRVLLIRDGSLLDTESLRLIQEQTADRGYQVWLEQVDESGAVGVVIEDGMVVGEPPFAAE